MELKRLAITMRILELHDKPIISESKAELGQHFLFYPSIILPETGHVYKICYKKVIFS